MPRIEYRKAIFERHGTRTLDFTYQNSFRLPILGAFITYWVQECPNTGRLQLFSTLRGSTKKRFEGAEKIALRTSEGDSSYLPNGRLKNPVTIQNLRVNVWLASSEPPKRFLATGQQSRQSIRPRYRGNPNYKNLDRSRD